MIDRAALRLQMWLSNSTAEGQHFDIKQSLAFASRDNKREALKDLTGMGNGGGGTLVFGLAERKVGGESVVDHVVQLEDRTLPDRLGDLIASSVRPTMHWKPTIIDQPQGGYVLVVDIERSPLGPYMVESFGEHRYWRRVDDHTLPMDERLVHDIYAEAVRWQADRGALWTEMHLPLEPTWASRPWLSVAGIPEYLVSEPFDPAHTTADSLRYEAELTEHAHIAGLDELGANFEIWADGFVAETNAERAIGTSFPPAPQALLRIHRSGPIGVGLHLATPHRTDAVRALNAQLGYLGQLWTEAGVASVELRIELSRLAKIASNDRTGPYPVASTATGAPFPSVMLRDVVRVEELAAASSRHKLLRRFADRLANVFGESRQIVGFEIGHLHTPDGAADGIASQGWIHYVPWPYSQDALISVVGAVRRPEKIEAIGWWRDGALLDLQGQLIAVTEFSTLTELPADFMPATVMRSDDVEKDHRSPEQWDPQTVPPRCTGGWSPQPLSEFLQGQSQR